MLFGTPKPLFGKYARKFVTGEVLFCEGDESREVYFVYSGEIGIFLGNRDQLRQIGTIQSGKIFGEMAL